MAIQMPNKKVIAAAVIAAAGAAYGVFMKSCNQPAPAPSAEAPASQPTTADASTETPAK